ncbi:MULTISPECIES: NTP transferase domain-containing protein [Flavobacterium]|uniref:phosphocholine cytidylyltransferase family protein n=1 Tax=Flavobacterium TaxID=237 RepID=UPI0039193C07
MKIVILAAGIGSRLGNPFPKPLTTLDDGKSIMERQIDNITQYFDINDIFIVVGFKKELIMERFDEVAYVYNPLFDCTNTSKSLLKVLKKFKNEPVLWFNGDVVFDAKLLSELMPTIKEDKSFVAVNTSRVSDEEVKYTLTDGYIDELSKVVKNGLGEAVGINFISSGDLQSFVNRLEEVDDNDYFERGLELAIQRDNLKIKPIDISQYDCIEVDFKEDLANANQLLKK